MGHLAHVLGSIAFGHSVLDPHLGQRLLASCLAVGGYGVHDDHLCALTVPQQAGQAFPLSLYQDERGTVTLLTGCLFDSVDVARSLSVATDTPDTVLLAHWITRRGAETLGELAGDFALAHWSPADQRLVLAVAPLAGRLLYWHRDGTDCHFANTVALLQRIPTVPRTLDMLALTTRFAGRVGDLGRSVYQNIGQVPPGTLLDIRADGQRHVPLWQPENNQRIRLSSDQEYLEQADALLQQAVARRLRQTSKPAFLASGGLDSTAMLTAALRQQQQPVPVHSYTVVPPPGLSVTADRGWYADERPKIAALAADYPALQTTLCHSSTPSAIETDPTLLFQTTGQPCSNACHLGWFSSAYQAMQKQGHDVALNAGMGNFSLSYDGFLCFYDLVRDGRPLTALRLLRQVARYQGKALLPFLRATLINPMIPRPLFYQLRRLRNRPPPLTAFNLLRQSWIEQVGVEDYLDAHDESLVQTLGTSSRQQCLYFLNEKRVLSLPSSMALEITYGLHLRDVFADRDLLEFCLAIPREQYILDGRPRSLIRRLLQDRAPDSIVNESLGGQQAVEWPHRLQPQRAAFADALDSFADNQMLPEMLDLPRLRHLLDQWPEADSMPASNRLLYGFTVSNAIQMGRFVRWASGSNR